jgi:hypothetical protein
MVSGLELYRRQGRPVTLGFVKDSTSGYLPYVPYHWGCSDGDSWSFRRTYPGSMKARQTQLRWRLRLLEGASRNWLISKADMTSS